MTVYESIETRKSIRDFEKRPVEPEKLQRILEAGRLAPTARCSNATRFIVVDDPDLMKKVQEACMGQALMGKAPMAVIVCSDSTRVMGCDQRASTVDCSIAMSFMMLAATAEGLGTCWIGGFTQEPLKEALGIPAEWIAPLQKAGYLTIDALAEANPNKLQQEICGVNKKYKLELNNPSNDDVKSWVERAKEA